MTSPCTTHLSIEAGVAVLEFDNPPHNRLARDMLLAFEQAIAAIREDDSVRVVILSAKGSIFSHGGDISIWPGVPPAEMRQRIIGSIKRANLLEELTVPTIAAVQGDCFGGGFEYALRCDVIVAADDAHFCHTEQSLGVFTLLGGVQRVAERAGRARAMKWALTSERVGAQELLDAGVLTEVVPSHDVMPRAREWAKRFATGPTLAHAAHKRLLQAWSNHGIAAADDCIPELTETIFGSADAKRGIASGLDALQRGVERPTLAFEGK
ncbi:enoyl-CoA hydratase/isomerase family protein [Variovorax arabinosiphilus]|uniref:enoyl-CoA hydratase/isomerase family protein n=1 Tax=Variovorax arabinosiphilus TaxID=3053498 RepID=UPI0025776122|nr:MULTISPECIES: enoyl-CoA hydratase/isomerase family protein [unclassified Variovorax]MDM0118374.1 enoyl-CoA hydratase/isomerase family protein [Variovorax sp. J2L1-78]MDM0128799.1 enoyl-CoA hydratase/isomerase family protein [Variovorax sp. J2L1-63]MDM0233415.1 enoyl-CoA hydratase/isomerase family protein [Variovorax sp. J2R1-6]